MATLKEIASRANVSINTASRILTGKNKELWPSTVERAQRVRRIAHEMGYRPNAAARSMRDRRSRHLGILMSGAHASPYEFPVIMGINQGLRGSGYTLNVISSSMVDYRQPENIPAFQEHFMAGVFVMHVPFSICKYAQSLFECCIHIDSNVRNKNGCIYRDEYHAARLATDMAIEKGYRQVLFLGYEPWPDCHIHLAERRRGYEEALRVKGIMPEVVLFNFAVADNSDKADLLAARLRPEVCVIASGQKLAEWCVHVAGRRGIYPGRDFGLASCDALHDCGHVWPWLSRVTFDRIKMGYSAAEMLLSRLREKKRVASVVLRDCWIPGETL